MPHIRGTDWDDGRQDRLVGRKGDTITYRAYARADDGTPFRHELGWHLGVIAMSITGPGRDTHYAWDSPLPGKDDLVAGASFVLKGKLASTVETLTVSYEATGIDQEVLTIAGCSDPVVTVRYKMIEGAKAGSVMTYWLHKRSWMVLKTEGHSPGGISKRQVVALQ